MSASKLGALYSFRILSWDQIATFDGHLDRRTTKRYIHFMPKDKRATMESVPFEF